MNEVVKAYALILGNEIVMADSRVDEESQWILADLDVQVSKSKSLPPGGTSGFAPCYLNLKLFHLPRGTE